MQAASSSSWTPPLRFISWNILGDSLLRQNAYLYRRCHPQALQHGQRIRRVVDGIARLNGDVLALQEVENFDRDILRPLSAMGLTGIFKKRTGDQLDGVALMWRTNRLQLLRHEMVEYASSLTKGVVSPILRDQFLRHNVGICALFLDLATGRQFVVATTHILWNPRRGLVKLRQIEHLMARADAMRASACADVQKQPQQLNMPPQGSPPSQSAPPAVLLGDFNCMPGSLLHSFLLGRTLSAPLGTERHWDGQEAAQKAMRKSDGGKGGGGGGKRENDGHAFRDQGASDADHIQARHALSGALQSAYGHVGEPECTSFHGGFAGTVDYILFGHEAFAVRTVLPTPTLGDLIARRSLPDFGVPSDHVPIACDLAWK